MDGVTVVPWKSGRALTWDIACCDIFALSYSTVMALGAGMVARRAEE